MAQTKDARRDEVLSAVERRLEVAVEDLTWSTREKLALACGVAFDAGLDSGLSGQFTARADDRSHFYTVRYGLGLDEVTAADFIEVDADLNVISGDGTPNPGNRFHGWIYRVRPDVNCVIHTHALYVSALSMLEQPLVVSHMDACQLFGDCAFLKTWPGVPNGDEEGTIISEALGDKRAILLSHHGLLTTGASVEEACVLAIRFEHAARLQLLALSAGKIQPIDGRLAREAHDITSTAKRAQANFAHYARRALRNHPDILGSG